MDTTTRIVNELLKNPAFPAVIRDIVSQCTNQAQPVSALTSPATISVLVSELLSNPASQLVGLALSQDLYAVKQIQ